jgi:hypothetical protein
MRQWQEPAQSLPSSTLRPIAASVRQKKPFSTRASPQLGWPPGMLTWQRAQCVQQSQRFVTTLPHMLRASVRETWQALKFNIIWDSEAPKHSGVAHSQCPEGTLGISGRFLLGHRRSGPHDGGGCAHLRRHVHAWPAVMRTGIHDVFGVRVEDRLINAPDSFLSVCLPNRAPEPKKSGEGPTPCLSDSFEHFQFLAFSGPRYLT